MQFSLNRVMLKVSNDNLEKHPRKSSEDVQLLHPPTSQFEERAKYPSCKLYSNP